ncbi:MAG: leucine-rich repeat domain-containing protein [Promethearchaeota archaeon]
MQDKFPFIDAGVFLVLEKKDYSNLVFLVKESKGGKVVSETPHYYVDSIKRISTPTSLIFKDDESFQNFLRNIKYREDAAERARNSRSRYRFGYNYTNSSSSEYELLKTWAEALSPQGNGAIVLLSAISIASQKKLPMVDPFFEFLARNNPSFCDSYLDFIINHEIFDGDMKEQFLNAALCPLLQYMYSLSDSLIRGRLFKRIMSVTKSLNFFEINPIQKLLLGMPEFLPWNRKKFSESNQHASISQKEASIISLLEFIIEKNIPEKKKLKENDLGYVQANGHVVSLSLFDSNLTLLPAAISHLAELKILNLKKNNLCKLPINFPKLRKLQKLTLRWNKFTEVPPELAQLTNLSIIDLYRNSISKYPDWLSKHPGITIVDLRLNYIEPLPDNCGDAPKLKNLKIQSHYITDVPDSILKNTIFAKKYADMKLPDRKLFALFEYQFGKRIPEKDYTLENGHVTELKLVKEIRGDTIWSSLLFLKKLDLSECNMYYLSASPLSKLPNLQHLKLPSFRPKILEQFMENSSLTKLEVPGTPFPNVAERDRVPLILLNALLDSKIPVLSSFDWNKPGITVENGRVKTLSLPEKKLAQIPETIGNLSELRVLDIGKNNISEIPDSFEELKKLEFANLSLNQLTKFPESLLQLPSLKELKVNGNPIDEIPWEKVKASSISIDVKSGTGGPDRDLFDEVKSLLISLGYQSEDFINHTIFRKTLTTKYFKPNWEGQTVPINFSIEEKAKLRNASFLLFEKPYLNQISFDTTTQIQLKVYKFRDRIELIKLPQKSQSNLQIFDSMGKFRRYLEFLEEISRCEHDREFNQKRQGYEREIDDHESVNWEYITALQDAKQYLRLIRGMNHRFDWHNRWDYCLVCKRELKYSCFPTIEGGLVRKGGRRLCGSCQSDPKIVLKQLRENFLGIELSSLFFMEESLPFLLDQTSELTNISARKLKRYALRKNPLKLAPTTLIENSYRKKMRALPRRLDFLRVLKIFNCAFKSLVGLPVQIPNLEELHVEKTDVYSLFGIPQELPELQILNLRYNNINSLLGLPQRLPKVTSIELRSNKLSDLEGFPQILPSLVFLDLSRNKITHLDDFPDSLQNIDTILLNRNRIKSLVGLPKKMPRLVRLDLSSNEIDSLVGLPQSLPNLEELDLSNNRLSDLVGFPTYTPSLRVLKLRDNPLTDFRGLPNFLPNLEVIDFRSTYFFSFECFPQNLPKLQTIYFNELRSLAGLSRNLFEEVTKKFFQDLNLDNFTNLEKKLILDYKAGNDDSLNALWDYYEKTPTPHLSESAQKIFTLHFREDVLRKIIEPRQFSEGEQYHGRHRVKNGQINLLSRVLSGQFVSYRRVPLECSIEIINSELICSCSCGIGGNCLHCVALFLDWRENPGIFTPIGNFPLHEEPLDEQQDLDVEIGPEASIIQELSALIGRKIPKVEDLQTCDLGYVVKDKHVSSLKITGANLTGPDVNFSELKSLEYLVLENNNLRHIPNSLKKCKNLKSLALCFNDLTKIPNWLGNGDGMALRELDLSFNSINEILVGLFENSLEIINLAYNCIENFPKLSTENDCLRELYLRGNNLQNFPTSILKLKGLETLDLKENPLQVLPREIKSFPKLEFLFFQPDSITQLGRNVSELPSLISKYPSGLEPRDILILSSIESRIKTNLFPSGVEPDPKGVSIRKGRVVGLSLHGTRLKEFPVEITRLQALENLDLSNNYLRSLSPRMSELVHLKTLNVNNNQLQGIPTSLFSIKSLERIYLKKNKITKLQGEIGALQNLEVLDLSNNDIQEFPPEMGLLQNLWVLNYDEWKVKEIPEPVFRIPDFSVKYPSTDLKERKFLWVLKHELKKEISFIKISLPFYYTSNNPPIVVINEGRITELHINECNMTKFPPGFECLNKLKILNLAKNNIPEIPAGIGKLTHLEEAYFQSNKITEIPEQIMDLKHLKEIELIDNEITKIPSSFVTFLNKKQLFIDVTSDEERIFLYNVSILREYCNRQYILPVLQDQQEFRNGYMAEKGHVTFLSLTDSIKNLPSSISHLKYLETLRIDEKRVRKLSLIPPEFGDTPFLKKRYPNIESAQERVGVFLLQLRYSNIYLKRGVIVENANVVEVKLVGIKMEKVPRALSYFTKLRALDLSRTGIKSLEYDEPEPKPNFTFELLENLALNGNNLTDLPNGIKNLQNLKNLSINNNRFSEVPKVIEEMPNIETLSVKNNQISELPDWISGLERLSIKLYGNPLKTAHPLLKISEKFSFIQDENERKIAYLIASLFRLPASQASSVFKVNEEGEIVQLLLSDYNVGLSRPLSETIAPKWVNSRLSMISQFKKLEAVEFPSRLTVVPGKSWFSPSVQRIKFSNTTMEFSENFSGFSPLLVNSLLREFPKYYSYYHYKSNYLPRILENPLFAPFLEEWFRGFSSWTPDREKFLKLVRNKPEHLKQKILDVLWPLSEDFPTHDYKGVTLVGIEYIVLFFISYNLPLKKKWVTNSNVLGCYIKDQHVKHLRLCNKKLTEEVAGLKYLKSLESLDLHGNDIQSLSEDLLRIKSLALVNLAGNERIKIPEVEREDLEIVI